MTRYTKVLGKTSKPNPLSDSIMGDHGPHPEDAPTDHDGGDQDEGGVAANLGAGALLLGVSHFDNLHLALLLETVLHNQIMDIFKILVTQLFNFLVLLGHHIHLSFKQALRTRSCVLRIFSYS